MIVETTNYFALPGKARDALAQRRRATQIRLSLGLPPGRILVRLEGDGPDIRWECSFPDRAAYDADRAVRSASGEFEASRSAMHALLTRFERHVYEQIGDDMPVTEPDGRSGS